MNLLTYIKKKEKSTKPTDPPKPEKQSAKLIQRLDTEVYLTNKK